jgi:hypothetical protein
LKNLFLAPAILSLVACTQHPDLYARYEPSGAEDVWVQGTRLHKAATPAGTRPSLEFSSGFVGKTLDHVQYDTTSTSPIRFSVRIGNTGDSAVLIEPTRFRLWAAESSWAYRALDPEKVILAAERNMRMEQDNYAASEGIEALLTLPVAVASVIPSRTGEEAKAKAKYWKEQEEQDARDEERHARKMGAADQVRRNWSELSLRKTTLFPGKEVHGLVSFIDDAPFKRPDSLEIQYEVEPGRFLDLGRYGKLLDSAAILRKQQAKAEWKKRPGSTLDY